MGVVRRRPRCATSKIQAKSWALIPNLHAQTNRINQGARFARLSLAAHMRCASGWVWSTVSSCVRVCILASVAGRVGHHAHILAQVRKAMTMGWRCMSNVRLAPCCWPMLTRPPPEDAACAQWWPPLRADHVDQTHAVAIMFKNGGATLQTVAFAQQGWPLRMLTSMGEVIVFWLMCACQGGLRQRCNSAMVRR